MDRQIESRARNELLVVEIAAIAARWQSAERTPCCRRRNGHDAEEGLQRKLESPGQPARHPLAVERDVHEMNFVEIVGQGPFKRRGIGEAPIVMQLDVLDANLENLSGFGAPHSNRTRADVAR